MSHTAYDTRNLTLEQKEDILRRAKEVCDTWWVDELDCNKSFHRQRIDMDFDEIMEKLEPGTHFVIIHRHHDPENYLEIVFRTMADTPDYFLWIQLDPKHIPEFTKDTPAHTY